VPGALQGVEGVRRALPHEPVVATSAAAERWLCQQRRAGAVAYHPGAGQATEAAPGGAGAAAAAGGVAGDQVAAGDAASGAGAGAAAAAVGGAGGAGPRGTAAVALQLQQLQERVLGPLGSTGVLAALTTAACLAAPRWVFPVGDRGSLAALAARVHSSGAGGGVGAGLDARQRYDQGGRPGVLRDCLLMRPGSTVGDVYQALRRPPYQLLEGEFVRAECAGAGGAAEGEGGGGGGRAAWRVVRKADPLSPGGMVLLIMTNKKVAWQAAARR